MKRFTITKANFLNWYFNSGADQDQSQMRVDLGQRVVDSLISDHKSTITTKDIWDECEKSCIPLRYTEEDDFDSNQELGELEYEWTIKLI